jgi:hypothetical protein
MYSQQLAVAVRAAALAAEDALQRLAAPEDHHHAQIAGARAALERFDDTQALCALVWTSAELAAAVGEGDHALIIEALCDLHAAAITAAAGGTRPVPRSAHRTGARR